MKLQILGCAGGIGGRERFTTCLRLDNDILLDAGTGLTNLDIDQLRAIDHVFLTHCHLDHVAGLALLVDATFGKRSRPLTVHATEEIIAPLKQHLFNWLLWPDFAELPAKDNAVMRWEPMAHGATIALGGRRITSHPVTHVAGSSAYAVRAAGGGFLFTGDMCSTPGLWSALAQDTGIGSVIVDCSFPDAEANLAELSKHFSPGSLLNDIHAMPDATQFLIYHLKPGQEEMIMSELLAAAGNRRIRAIRCGETIEF
jgi:3',5'-cyclic-nucleotide phosphodiesterase